MRETVEIKLAKPIKTHEGPLDTIVLREPTFDEYLEYGDPYTVAAGAGGTPFAVENVEVIKQYMALCLVQPKNVALLAQESARVARQVKEALLGFFQPAKPAGEALETSGTNSPSGDTASSPTASKG